MRRKILFIILILAATLFHAHSQRLAFDGTGRLIKISKDSLITFDEKSLSKIDSTIKNTASEIFVKKIDEALKIIQSNLYKKTLHQFFLWLWDGPNDSVDIVNYLQELRLLLSSRQMPASYSKMAEPFMKAASRHLLIDTLTVFRAVVNKQTKKLELVKIDPFNLTLIDYYNATLLGLTDSIKLLTNEFDNYISYLQTNLDTIKSLLRTLRENLQFDITMYQTTKKFRTALYQGNSTLSHLKKEFSKPWFKQWFWFRGGEIRLNPFNFTSEEFIRRNPMFDVDKVNLFNLYINSLLNRQIRYDSVGHIEEFINKLRLKNTGEMLFSLQNRNDSLRRVNEEELSKLLTSEQVLNKVEIPVKDDFASVSAVKEIDLGTDLKFLSKPIHVNEAKTIVIHNVADASKPGLVQTEKAITDRSAFQDGLDTVVSQLGEIAQVVEAYTPFSGILDFFLPQIPVPNNQILQDATINGAVDSTKIRPNDKLLHVGFVTIRYGEDTKFNSLKSAVGAALNRSDLLDRSLYWSTFEKLVDKDLSVLESDTSSLHKFARTLDEYIATLQRSQIDSLIKDSILIAGLKDIFNYSTFPIQDPLKPRKTPSPVFRTQILKTDPASKAVEKNVIVYTTNKSDTIDILKFSYNVGKGHRFSLGGGIAYTFTPYSQSVASENNGSIAITNNVRQYQLVVSLHTYLGKKGLFNQDNSFWGKNKERLFAFVGVGIPRPLENVYLGLGKDLWPGLKLTVGLHLARHNYYKIQNDEIIEEKLNYKLAGPFAALSFDPTSFLNLLNVFKKQ